MQTRDILDATDGDREVHLVNGSVETWQLWGFWYKHPMQRLVGKERTD